MQALLMPCTIYSGLQLARATIISNQLSACAEFIVTALGQPAIAPTGPYSLDNSVKHRAKVVLSCQAIDI